MQPILKTEILIYQSKANLDEKNWFGKITHLGLVKTHKFEKPVRGLNKNRRFQVHSGPRFI